MDSKDFIEQYVLSMKSVKVNKDKIRRVILEEKKKGLLSHHVEWKRFSACVCICLIIICVILIFPFTVYKKKKHKLLDYSICSR